MLRNKLYYNLKPLMPRFMQIALRRFLANRKRKLYDVIWPIDKQSLKIPEKWTGWPYGKRFAFILTHDVEGKRGVGRCLALAKLEEKMGFRSSFNFVIQDYFLPPELRETLVRRGFEIGVHGLTHDGKHLLSKKSFLGQCSTINQHIEKWGAVGSRTPSMLGNIEWMDKLDIEYDASTFDTDPFEPQPFGVKRIFPFWVKPDSGGKGFVELPYTLAQDFTLFVILQEKKFDLWASKLEWIVQNGGMALLIVHPDYVNFQEGKHAVDEYPIKIYQDFLNHVKERYEGQYWNALPREIAKFWKEFEKGNI